MQEQRNRSIRDYHGPVLVTGAAGHLGANLVRRLLAEGREVRVLLREDSNNEAVAGLALERHYGDLRDRAAVERAIRGCALAFHCAAKVSTLQGNAAHKREVWSCNVIGTRNLLDAARAAEVERVVVTGSFGAVGYDLDDPSLPADERRPFYPFATHLPYARTKLLTELECLRAAADGLDVVMCTSTAILGPHDYKPSRMGKTLIDFAHGKLRAYIPGGFAFVSARDIVEGHLLALERGRRGHKYIIATEYLSLDDIMDIFEEVTGRPRPRIRLHAGAMHALSHVSTFVLSTFFPQRQQRFTPDAVRILRLQRRADTSKAERELGFRPGDIRQAVAEAYEDFARRGLVPARVRAVRQSDVREVKQPADRRPGAAA
jgi:nucleoside-diphosphate-sugar epimerase